MAAGADVVMLGSLLAGHRESLRYRNLPRKSYKVYRSMGSIAAMKQGSTDRYFQDEQTKLVPEVSKAVAFQGPLSETVFQLVGGLRADGVLWHQGFEELKRRLYSCGLHLQVSRSHPHGHTDNERRLTITSETHF